MEHRHIQVACTARPARGTTAPPRRMAAAAARCGRTQEQLGPSHCPAGQPSPEHCCSLPHLLQITPRQPSNSSNNSALSAGELIHRFLGVYSNLAGRAVPLAGPAGFCLRAQSELGSTGETVSVHGGDIGTDPCYDPAQFEPQGGKNSWSSIKHAGRSTKTPNT